jgi:hypothetical protein
VPVVVGVGVTVIVDVGVDVDGIGVIVGVLVDIAVGNAIVALAGAVAPVTGTGKLSWRLLYRYSYNASPTMPIINNMTSTNARRIRMLKLRLFKVFNGMSALDQPHQW